MDMTNKALSVIASYKAGRIDWAKMVGVLRSIPWVDTKPSGDWMAAADIPVTDGPTLTGTLGAALATGDLTSAEADRLDAALT